MKAGEWKCPECGAGFRDVAPDFWVGPPREDELPGAGFGAVAGHCTNGHHFFLGWQTEPESVTYKSESVQAVLDRNSILRRRP